MKSTPAAKTRHPKGLPFLFLTEMWERFGYYLMLGIFVLYMIDVKSGLSIPDRNADDIFGTFIAITYLTPFLGGFLADRKLGYIRSVYLGGLLMALGYIGLALPGMPMFYTSVVLIVIGNGFFKPNISTLLGNLYSRPEYRNAKDSGYNLFYMGINIGAFIAPIVAAYMRNKYDWGAAFITAGVGMLIGLVVFSFGLRHLRAADEIKPVEEGDASMGRVFGLVFLPALIAGAIGWIAPPLLFGVENIFGSSSTDAFLFAVVPVIIFYISIWWKASPADKRPIAALLVIFALSAAFWAVFKQNGTALTRWAKYYTDREVPALLEGPARALYQVEEIPTAPSMAYVYDEEFRAVVVEGEPVKALGREAYFKNVPEEAIPTDGEPVFLISTELFQSINPAWVILLTPLLVAFFTFLRKRNREPSTATKIVYGLFISGLSTVIMVFAVYAGNNGEVKVSGWWLVGCYSVITLGELLLSPMGLSLVSKLSPPRITALMMGGFFLSTAIGNKMSGVLSSLWYEYENKANFFWFNGFLLLISAGLALAVLRWLNRIMKERQVH